MHSVTPASSGSCATRSRTRCMKEARCTRRPRMKPNAFIEGRTSFSMSGNLRFKVPRCAGSSFTRWLSSLFTRTVLTSPSVPAAPARGRRSCRSCCAAPSAPRRRGGSPAAPSARRARPIRGRATATRRRLRARPAAVAAGTVPAHDRGRPDWSARWSRHDGAVAAVGDADRGGRGGGVESGIELHRRTPPAALWRATTLPHRTPRRCSRMHKPDYAANRNASAALRFRSRTAP
jgi:hypothetical protein